MSGGTSSSRPKYLFLPKWDETSSSLRLRRASGSDITRSVASDRVGRVDTRLLHIQNFPQFDIAINLAGG
jgi:hypothetical protein